MAHGNCLHLRTSFVKGEGGWEEGPPLEVATFDHDQVLTRPRSFGSAFFLCSRNCHSTHTRHHQHTRVQCNMRVSGRKVPARAHLAWRARRTCSPGRQVPPGLCHAGTSERLPGSGGQNQREAVLPGGRKEAEKARSRVWLVGLLALALSGLAAASPTRTADSPNCTWCHRLMLVPSGASARFLGHLAAAHIASHEGPSKVEQLCEHLARRSAASPPMLREVKLTFTFLVSRWAEVLESPPTVNS